MSGTHHLPIATSRPRKIAAFSAVILLHAVFATILLGSFRFFRAQEKDFAPLALKFFPEPAPPIPYLPQRFTAPLITPRLNAYAPLPDLVIPFVPLAAAMPSRCRNRALQRCKR